MGAGIVPATRFVDMTGYGTFVDEASGQRVDISKDLNRLARDPRALSPADGRLVDELIASARACKGRPEHTDG
jgi:hypothetical protein